MWVKAGIVGIGKWVSALLGFALLLGVAQAEQRVVMRRNDQGAEKAFLDRLEAEIDRRINRPGGYSGVFFYIGRADLNDDGQHELFIVTKNGNWCGSAPNCSAHIYVKQEEGWQYSGTVTADRTQEGYELFVQEQKYNGWRRLSFWRSEKKYDLHPGEVSDAEFQACWVPRFDIIYPQGSDLRRDLFDDPIPPDRPGYFSGCAEEDRDPRLEK